MDPIFTVAACHFYYGGEEEEVEVEGVTVEVDDDEGI